VCVCVCNADKYYDGGGVVIGSDCWGPLREASKTLLSAALKDKVPDNIVAEYPQSVVKSLSLISTAKSPKQKKQIASILMYTTYLIQFYQYVLTKRRA
jgi:hypothetical protein